MRILAEFLRVDAATWSRIGGHQLRAKALMVVFAYLVMAWNRFGLLGFVAPRAPIRMLLIGFYSWVALAALVWILSARASPGLGPRLSDVAAAIAHAHFPLLMMGFFMAVLAGFLRILGPGKIVAVIVFALWMPVLLMMAIRHTSGLSRPRALALLAVPYGLWLLGPGLFLNEQVGHLL